MAIITGTPDTDMLDGTEFDDSITAGAGNDGIWALSGNDLIKLGSGDDLSENWDGNDTVYGGLGNDDIFARGGDDLIYGGGGGDYIQANDRDFGGTGTVYGGAGGDSVTIYSTGGGAIYGGTGTDLIFVYALTDENLLIDFDNNLLEGGGAFAPGVTFSSFEELRVVSGNGDDTVLGGRLDDQLSVGRGANNVNAKGGDDTVAYVAGTANTLRGGEGDDILIVSNSFYFLTREDGTVDDGSLSDILGFERYQAFGTEFDDIVSLGEGKDSFTGAEGKDSAFGRDGADMLSGESGADSLEGGQGRDTLLGGSGNDTIRGDSGNDRITGGAGNDVIRAGAGDDRIRFDTGNDTVSGGLGADAFQFISNQSGFHTITDFEVGLDSLQFTGAFLQQGPAPGPLDPGLLSFGVATGPQAQFVLTYSALTDTTALHWDASGDDPLGGTISLVTLSGQVNLTAADILIL